MSEEDKRQNNSCTSVMSMDGFVKLHWHKFYRFYCDYTEFIRNCVEMLEAPKIQLRHEEEEKAIYAEFKA